MFRICLMSHFVRSWYQSRAIRSLARCHLPFVYDWIRGYIHILYPIENFKFQIESNRIITFRAAFRYKYKMHNA